jgi:hypothetical protein
MAANGISTLANKQLRQVAKLDFAQARRKGQGITEGSGTWSTDGVDDDTANSYRSNNTYDITALPTNYVANTVNDIANTGGLLSKRPWVSVSEIAAPVSIQEAVGGDTIVNLQVWYDGADTTQYVPSATDETGITQLKDKSAFAHNANPLGGASVRPSYEDTVLQNGYGYIEFDGVDDNFYINPFTQISEQNTYTIFLTAKLLSTADGQSLCGVNRSGLSINTIGGVFQTTTAALAGTTTIAPDTDWHVFALRVDLTQAANADKSLLLIDGHDKATGANDITSYSGTANATTGVNDGFYLGARGAGGSSSAAPTDYANMYLGEVLMFNYALTDIEVKNVNNYLANKWGL